jgi:hypothetical protein
VSSKSFQKPSYTCSPSSQLSQDEDQIQIDAIAPAAEPIDFSHLESNDRIIEDGDNDDCYTPVAIPVSLFERVVDDVL